MISNATSGSTTNLRTPFSPDMYKLRVFIRVTKIQLWDTFNRKLLLPIQFRTPLQQTFRCIQRRFLNGTILQPKYSLTLRSILTQQWRCISESRCAPVGVGKPLDHCGWIMYNIEEFLIEMVVFGDSNAFVSCFRTKKRLDVYQSHLHRK